MSSDIAYNGIDQSHQHKHSDNTNYKYYQHVVSQEINPLKTTLGVDDTTENQSALYSQQPHPQQRQVTPKLAENQSSQKKKAQVEDTDSTISDEQLVDQYEIMQRQMQRIRQEHLGNGTPQHQQQFYSQNPQAQKLLYQNQGQEESSSDLSSDDEDALTGRNQAISGVDDSDSSSLQSEVNH